MQARGEGGKGTGEPCCPLTRPKLGPRIRRPGVLPFRFLGLTPGLLSPHFQGAGPGIQAFSEPLALGLCPLLCTRPVDSY